MSERFNTRVFIFIALANASVSNALLTQDIKQLCNVVLTAGWKETIVFYL